MEYIIKEEPHSQCVLYCSWQHSSITSAIGEGEGGRLNKNADTADSGEWGMGGLC